MLRTAAQIRDGVALDQRSGKVEMERSIFTCEIYENMNEVSRMSPRCLNGWVHKVPFVISWEDEIWSRSRAGGEDEKFVFDCVKCDMPLGHTSEDVKLAVGYMKMEHNREAYCISDSTLQPWFVFLLDKLLVGSSCMHIYSHDQMWGRVRRSMCNLLCCHEGPW